jgi:hypothetical protein
MCLPKGQFHDLRTDLKIWAWWRMEPEPDENLVKVCVPHALAGHAGSETRVGLWHLSSGAIIREGQRLVELVQGPVSFVIHSPCDGRLVKRVAREDDTIRSGELLGVIRRNGYDSGSES